MRSIDLHAHTTASDGDHSPTQLVEHAARIGLTALAVTDHDTTAGVEEAVEVGRRIGIEVIPGIELSAEVEAGQCHILGLFIDPRNGELLRRLEEVVENRNTRNARIAEKMRAHGVDVTLEEIEAEAGGQIVARPHMAAVLLRKGVVATKQEAFDRYLGKGALFYVERDRLTQEEAIELIHQAGGVAILAHPNNLKRDRAATEDQITRMQGLGLDGIEARYNLHTAEENACYLALAERRELLTSGGSDFHGPTVKPDVFLGHVEGKFPAPTELLEALRARAEQRLAAR